MVGAVLLLCDCESWHGGVYEWCVTVWVTTVIIVHCSSRISEMANPCSVMYCTGSLQHIQTSEIRECVCAHPCCSPRTQQHPIVVLTQPMSV